MRRTAATASLVEQDDPVGASIEEATDSGRTPRARTTMEDDSGFAIWMAARLPVHQVPIADIEPAVVVWFDFWVKLRHSFSGERCWTALLTLEYRFIWP
jgi:hypothetical protein